MQVAPSVADYVRANVQSARKQGRISEYFFLQRVVVNAFDLVAPFDARFHLRTEQGRVLDAGKALERMDSRKQYSNASGASCNKHKSSADWLCLHLTPCPALCAGESEQRKGRGVQIR